MSADTTLVALTNAVRETAHLLKGMREDAETFPYAL